jgi:hypothetical protein
MAAMTAVFLMVVAGSFAWAQNTDRDSCVDSCERAKENCINICTTHENPMECEEDCQAKAVACNRQCR